MSGAGGLWLLCRKLYDIGKSRPEKLKYFEELNGKKAYELFGDVPLLEERVKIWNEIATNLKKYDNSFRNFINENDKNVKRNFKLTYKGISTSIQ